MRNKRLLIALSGAVLFGVVAAVAVTRYLSSAQAYTKNLNGAVIARTNIPIGSKITKDQLETAMFPRSSMPDGAFDSLDQVVGRVAIANIGIREPITNSKLAPSGAAGGLPAVIPEGYRAMTVKVDDVVGISGFILPGSFVDVVAVINPPEQSNSNPVSKIVLQNIKVLASGPNIDHPADEREPTSVKAVTLQVTPEQAEKLALAANEGKLQLVMRNYGDQGDAETDGVNKRSLLTGEPMTYENKKLTDEAAKVISSMPPMRITVEPVRRQKPASEPVVAPVPAPAPPPPAPSVELIEGTKKSNVDFP